MSYVVLNSSLKSLAKNAGAVLYLDARKSTGNDKPINSPLTNPWVDLSGQLSSYNVTNVVTNGNFANGTTGWTIDSATSSVNNNIITVTGNGATAEPQLRQTLSSLNISSKFYTQCWVRVTNSNCESIKLLYDGVTGTDVVVRTIAFPSINVWYLVNGVRVFPIDATGANRIKIQTIYADTATANGKVMEVKEVASYDLTALFGSGAEPSSTECGSLFPFMATTGTISRCNNATPTNMAGTTSSGVDTTDPSKPFWVLDGTDDFFGLTKTASINITSAPLAIFATIKVSLSTASGGYIFGINGMDSTQIQYGLIKQAGANTISLITGNADTAGSVTISTGAWMNVGAIWSGTTVKYYLNLIKSGTDGNLNGPLTSRNNAQIGCGSNSADGTGKATFFKGNIATLSIYAGAKATEANILKAEKAISKAYIGG